METFDFTNTDNEYIHNMGSNMILHIKRSNHSVAVLYFTDEMSNKINIPDGIVVYTYDYQNIKTKVIHKCIGQAYPLCWTDNYTIELNAVEIIHITNQRKWNITNKLKY